MRVAASVFTPAAPLREVGHLPPNFSRPSWKDAILNYHQKPIENCRFSCDGAYLGSCSQDKVVKVGQVDNYGGLRVVHTVTSLTPMTQIAWHPTEPAQFVIAGDDKTIELWDVRASRATAKLASLGNNISISWSPDGRYLSLGNGVTVNGQACDRVVVMDLAAGKWIKKATFGFEINELEWGASSAHLLVATEYGNIDLLSVDADVDNQDMRLVDSFAAHTSNCFALKVDREYRKMAVGSADFNLSLWDLDDLVCTHTKAFESAVRFLAFSGDGKYVAVAPEGGSFVHVLDVASAETLQKVDCRPPTFHPAGGGGGGGGPAQSFTSVVSLAWHPRSALLAVGVKTEGKVSTQAPVLRMLSF